jgi:hypothetical protein
MIRLGLKLLWRLGACDQNHRAVGYPTQWSNSLNRPAIRTQHRSVLPQAAEEGHGRLPIKERFRAESKHEGK